MNIQKRGNDLILSIGMDELNLADTLDCGQCFRFTKMSPNTLTGIVHGRILSLTQTQTDITFYDTTAEEFRAIWCSYFDLDTDYDSIKAALSKDLTLQKALKYAGGIRILQQDSFEALLSFIISQNNNIPRIKASIDRLCKKFGQHIEGELYAFPDVAALSSVKKENLADIGLGYRDDYILDCVAKIHSGEISLEAIKKMPLEEARTTLRTIKGIGPKVAECALLFGFYRIEAFPIDTWIKKALKYYYPNGFPTEFERYAGIAQQYIFHYIRTCEDAIPAEFKK